MCITPISGDEEYVIVDWEDSLNAERVINDYRLVECYFENKEKNNCIAAEEISDMGSNSGSEENDSENENFDYYFENEYFDYQSETEDFDHQSEKEDFDHHSEKDDIIDQENKQTVAISKLVGVFKYYYCFFFFLNFTSKRLENDTLCEVIFSKFPQTLHFCIHSNSKRNLKGRHLFKILR